jgi:hypothetical protein
MISDGKFAVTQPRKPSLNGGIRHSRTVGDYRPTGYATRKTG